MFTAHRMYGTKVEKRNSEDILPKPLNRSLENTYGTDDSEQITTVARQSYNNNGHKVTCNAETTKIIGF